MGRLVSRVISFLRSWQRSPTVGLKVNAPDEQARHPQIVAIGVNETGKLNKAPLKLKAKHFRPRPEEDGRMALSTYCVDELHDSACWALLEIHIKPFVVARSELSTQVFREATLTVDPDWIPDRHVNIVDWPLEDEEINSITQGILSEAQRLIMRTA